MTLLELLKEKIGSTTKSDSFLIEVYIAPALDKISSIFANVKETTVSLSRGKQEYDLSDEDYASPVVSNGVQDIKIDLNDDDVYLRYNTDFYFSDRKTLVIVPDVLGNMEFTFKYNSFYKLPTLSNDSSPVYTETDLRSDMFNSVSDYANLLYRKDLILSDDSNISSKTEENISTTYSSTNSRLTAINNQLSAIENSWNNSQYAKPKFYSAQVI